MIWGIKPESEGFLELDLDMNDEWIEVVLNILSALHLLRRDNPKNFVSLERFSQPN